MRKLFLIVAVAFLALTMKVEAAPIAPVVGKTVVPFANGVGSSVTGVVVGGMIAPLVFMYLIKEGVDPWTPNFHSVVYEYPQQHGKF
jgi:hypothetical protein